MAQLRVVAQLTTKPGSEEIIREALARLAAATQDHRGCVEFKLYESAAAPGTFVTVETWESQDDHDAHMQTEDIAAALAAARVTWPATSPSTRCGRSEPSPGPGEVGAPLRTRAGSPPREPTRRG